MSVYILTNWNETDESVIVGAFSSLKKAKEAAEEDLKIKLNGSLIRLSIKSLEKELINEQEDLLHILCSEQYNVNYVTIDKFFHVFPTRDECVKKIITIDDEIHFDFDFDTELEKSENIADIRESLKKLKTKI